MTTRQPIKTDIRIEIAGANRVIDDADIELEIKKTNEKEPNYCTVTIYNCSHATYNQIKEEANYVKCYADINNEGYVLIFEGDLKKLKKDEKTKSKYTKTGKLRKKSKSEPRYNEPSVRVEDDGPNIKTIIELEDGFKTYFTNFHYKVSYSGNITNKIILNNCLKLIREKNIGLGQIDTLDEVVFKNGYSYSGPIFNLASQMATLGGCNLTIQNGLVSCVKKNIKNMEWVYVLDGSICAKPEENSNKEIDIDAPVLLALNPDNLVYLNFEEFKNSYKVYKIETKLNNFGGSGQGSKITVKSN